MLANRDSGPEQQRVNGTRADPRIVDIVAVDSNQRRSPLDQQLGGRDGEEGVVVVVSVASPMPVPARRDEHGMTAHIQLREGGGIDTKPGKISAELEPIGDRPAGHTDPNADIIRFAEAAYRTEGLTVQQGTSSTDSNIPMSLGIPAITMSRIADGGRAHAPDEWIDVAKAPNVKLKRILLATILATAGTR